MDYDLTQVELGASPYFCNQACKDFINGKGENLLETFLKYCTTHDQYILKCHYDLSPNASSPNASSPTVQVHLMPVCQPGQARVQPRRVRLQAG